MYSHYNYKVTIKSTNEYYIGKRSTTKEITKDSYTGSGTSITAYKKENGTHDLIKEVLSIHESSEAAYLEEAKLVTYKTLRDPLCLNRIPGGKNASTEKNKKLVYKMNDDFEILKVYLSMNECLESENIKKHTFYKAVKHNILVNGYKFTYDQHDSAKSVLYEESALYKPMDYEKSTRGFKEYNDKKQRGIKAVDKLTNEEFVFDGVKECQFTLKVSNVSQIATGKRKQTHRKYFFYYV
jgi:hypothetical protein